MNETPMFAGTEQVAAAAAFAAERGYSRPEPLSSGVEFLVFRTDSRSDGPLVLRVPRARTFHTANNVGVGAVDLMAQEYVLCRWLAERGFPVAEAVEFDTAGQGFPILVSRFVESDGTAPDWCRVGSAYAELHTMDPPTMTPVLQYGLDLGELVARRLPERLGRLKALIPQTPGLPPDAELAPRLTACASTPRLLHLDIRRQNLLCRSGRLVAAIDWSNVLVGTPRMELARLTEYAAIAENEIDELEFLRGYASVTSLPPPNPVADRLYRLDAAVMLALVFLSVAPNPVLGGDQVGRVHSLLRELETLW